MVWGLADQAGGRGGEAAVVSAFHQTCTLCVVLRAATNNEQDTFGFRSGRDKLYSWIEVIEWPEAPPELPPGATGTTTKGWHAALQWAE